MPFPSVASDMPIRGGCRRYHQTRDADLLASARIQGVLTLEVAL